MVSTAEFDFDSDVHTDALRSDFSENSQGMMVLMLSRLLPVSWQCHTTVRHNSVDVVTSVTVSTSSSVGVTN